jgi:hypothetical protein
MHEIESEIQRPLEIQGIHKRWVGFKVSSEENLLREKEQNMFCFTRKKTRISHRPYRSLNAILAQLKNCHV